MLNLFLIQLFASAFLTIHNFSAYILLLILLNSGCLRMPQPVYEKEKTLRTTGLDDYYFVGSHPLLQPRGLDRRCS